MEARYARQSVLDVIGQRGRRRLGQSSVLIVGCGALGSMQAELSARAGVGRIILVDRDVVELHNLQRQLLFDEQDVRERMLKAQAAARRLKAVNSDIAIEAVTADVTAANVESLLKSADLVLDGTDNFETRYLINDATVKANKPWVFGGVLKTKGTVMAICPGVGPCLRCLFPDPPDASDHFACEIEGVLNTAVAWAAALQVTSALKILIDGSTSSQFHSFDIWEGTTKTITVEQSVDCICCRRRNFEFLTRARGSSSTVFCGRNAVQITPETGFRPDFAFLRERLAAHGTVSVSGQVLEFISGEYRMIVFPDGRVMVMGTTEPSAARSMVAKFIGS
jgi:adenylyltransferase/sulfurtransferase